MTIKKITALAIGGLMALNIAGAVVPDISRVAEAASYNHNEKFRPNDDFNRAIRQEHERHEKKVHEIQKKYHSRSQAEKLHKEMRKERERHDSKMREINMKYHHRNMRPNHRR